MFNSSESKIPPQTASCIYGNDDEEIQEKLDQFKNEILDDIIQCGVYTDRYGYYLSMDKLIAISANSS